MTTDIRTSSNATYRQWLIDEPQRAVAQARAEGRIARGKCNGWRENALERAGDYALAGEWSESRRMAKQFEEA
jgi:hypothetical protein